MSKPKHHTELTADQCQRMNRVQELARQFGELLELERNNGANLRWCAIAAAHAAGVPCKPTTLTLPAGVLKRAWEIGDGSAGAGVRPAVKSYRPAEAVSRST